MSDSDNVSNPFDEDARTRFDLSAMVEPRVASDRLAHVYQHALSVLRADTEQHPPGYCVYWTDGDRMFQANLTTHPLDYLVLGRHSCCDIHLGNDPDISLRHLLIRAKRHENGPLALELIDLRAKLPFYLADNRPYQAITAAGPIALRLGCYTIVGLPVGEPSIKLPNELPPPTVTTSIEAIPPSWDDISQISVRKSVTSVGEFANSGLDTVGRLILRDRVRKASASVTEDLLRRGIIIGRYRRCIDYGLRAILDHGVSRAHLLVLGDDKEVFAYDLCSRNGTWLGERRVRCVQLTTSSGRIGLAREGGITLEWGTAGTAG